MEKIQKELAVRLTADDLERSKEIDDLLHLAEGGDAEAQAALGCRYWNDESGEKRKKEAIKWFEKAAAQGNALAEFKLALFYSRSYVRQKKDLKKAFRLFESAAEKGNLEALKKLSDCYLYGEGVDRNEEKANELYKKLLAAYEKRAVAGDMEAAYKLHELYFSVIYDVENKEKADFWLRRAAEGGHLRAQAELGRQYEATKEEDDSEAAREAFRFLLNAAEQGEFSGILALVSFYDNGVGVQRDEERAAYWLEKAAQQGDPRMQFRLAYRYDTGDGVPLDREKAFFWFAKAADGERYDEALYEMGCRLHDGIGVKKDFKKAFHFLEAAAHFSHLDAMVRLALMYLNGEGVQENREEARRWLERAVDWRNSKKAKNILKTL